MSGYVVIAKAVSRHGGRCAGCGRWIAAGEQIVKIDDGRRGSTTSYGNGAGGRWLGVECCADAAD